MDYLKQTSLKGSSRRYIREECDKRVKTSSDPFFIAGVRGLLCRFSFEGTLKNESKARVEEIWPEKRGRLVDIVVHLIDGWAAIDTRASGGALFHI